MMKKQDDLSGKLIRVFPVNDVHSGLKVGLAPDVFVQDAGTDYERRPSS